MSQFRNELIPAFLNPKALTISYVQKTAADQCVNPELESGTYTITAAFDGASSESSYTGFTLNQLFLEKPVGTKIGTVTITNSSSVIVRRFIPCLDSITLEPCLYDEKTDKFYYNQGSQHFNYDRSTFDSSVTVEEDESFFTLKKTKTANMKRNGTQTTTANQDDSVVTRSGLFKGVKGCTLVWNQMVQDASGSVSIATESGHYYYKIIGGTRSIVAGGSAITATGGTDTVIDLTRLFQTNDKMCEYLGLASASDATASTTVSRVQSLFPNSRYKYCSGRLLNTFGSVKLNQVVNNGNFSHPQSNGLPYAWELSGVFSTITTVDGTVTLSAYSNGDNYAVSATIPEIIGHKYMWRILAKSTSTAFPVVRFFFGTGDEEYGVVTVADQWQWIWGIDTCLSNVHNFIRLFAPHVGIVNQYRNCCIFDLTAMFGEGCEPDSFEEFMRLFPDDYYPYNPDGTWVHVGDYGVKSTGFNLYDFDNNHEDGAYDANGNKIEIPGDTRTIYPIRILPNTTYYCRVLSSAPPSGILGVFYDSGMSFTSRQGIGNITFTTGANTVYMNLFYDSSLNGMICINISDPAKNGTYEPYWCDELDLNGIQLLEDGSGNKIFPYGLQDANGVKDEMLFDRVIKRVGTIDIGDYDWHVLDTNCFQCGSNVPGKALTNNMVCSKYITSPPRYDSYATDAPDKSIWSYTSVMDRVRIKDTTYSTAPTASNNWLKGVLLNYELAEPKEYRYDFNIWDEQWEIGGIDPITGSNTVDGGRIRCKNFIKVLPSQSYYTIGNMAIVCYNENCDVIPGSQTEGFWAVTSDSTFTTASNARYIKFRMPSSYGTFYHNDLCINISEPDLNGTYSPYIRGQHPRDRYRRDIDGMESIITGNSWTQTTQDNIVRSLKDPSTGEPLFPQGLLKISTYDSTTGVETIQVADELTPTYAIKRVGCVELGTCTATYNEGNGYKCFHFYVTGIKMLSSTQYNVPYHLHLEGYNDLGYTYDYGVLRDKTVWKHCGGFDETVNLCNLDYNGSAIVNGHASFADGLYLYFPLQTEVRVDFTKNLQDSTLPLLSSPIDLLISTPY